MKSDSQGSARMGLFWIAVVAVMAVVPPVLAMRVFINGTEVSNGTVRSQEIQSVDSVEFDENGDIHINAPGYNVRTVRQGTQSATRSGSAPAGAVRGASFEPPQPHDTMATVFGERYYALFRNENVGEVPYEILLKINDEQVHRFNVDDRSTVVDVTGFLGVGDNTIEMVAFRATPTQAGTDNDATVRLAFGPGTVNENRATVRRTVGAIEMSVNATERLHTETFAIELDPHHLR